jgi:protein-S-isoprenylcysteine O-methyltransferase Ste14
MRLCLGISVVLLALLIAASAIAAITRGWVLPTNRKPIRRPQLYGWGQLIIAIALCCQGVFGLMTDDLDTRQWGTLTGSVLMVTGIIVIAVSQRTAGHRQRSSAP